MAVTWYYGEAPPKVGGTPNQVTIPFKPNTGTPLFITVNGQGQDPTYTTSDGGMTINLANDLDGSEVVYYELQGPPYTHQNRMWVADALTGVSQFNRNATGNVAPTTNLLFYTPTNLVAAFVTVLSSGLLAVTAFGGEPGVLILPKNIPSGLRTPLRIIASSLMPFPVGIQEYKGELYVAEIGNQSIYIFDPKSMGVECTPTRIITSGTFFDGLIGLSVVNDILYVVTSASSGGADNSTSAIMTFPYNASGNTAPTTRINGSNTTFNVAGESGCFGVVVQGTEIFVTTQGVSSPPDVTGAVCVFNTTDNGNVAPKRRIAGASTLLSQPLQLAYNTDDNTIVVANSALNPGVYSYGVNDNGNVVPTRNLSGVSTEQDATLGVALG